MPGFGDLVPKKKKNEKKSNICYQFTSWFKFEMVVFMIK